MWQRHDDRPPNGGTPLALLSCTQGPESMPIRSKRSQAPAHSMDWQQNYHHHNHHDRHRQRHCHSSSTTSSSTTPSQDAFSWEHLFSQRLSSDRCLTPASPDAELRQQAELHEALPRLLGEPVLVFSSSRVHALWVVQRRLGIAQAQQLSRRNITQRLADIGAKLLRKALRSNRTVQHHNQIKPGLIRASMMVDSCRGRRTTTFGLAAPDAAKPALATQPATPDRSTSAFCKSKLYTFSLSKNGPTRPQHVH